MNFRHSKKKQEWRDENEKKFTQISSQDERRATENNTYHLERKKTSQQGGSNTPYCDQKNCWGQI